MKILQLIPKMPYPPKDGGAIAAWNLTKGLSRCGHQISILAMNTDKHFTDPATLPDEILKTAEWNIVPVITRIRPLKALLNLLFSRLPYPLERFIIKPYDLVLRSLLEKNKYNLVQCEGLAAALYIPTIRKYSEARISYRAHNIEWEIWKRKADTERNILRRMYFLLISRRMKRYEEGLMNRFDLLLPITSRDEEVLCSMGNSKPSCVIPSGVDSETISFGGLMKSGLSYAYIGALDWMPNQEGLLWFLDKVWTPFFTAHKNLRFYVAGRNAPRWMEKKISRVPGVIYEGEIDESGVFISSHPVLVVPLFSGSGMRVKIIEGMSKGRIVVSTSIGAEGLPVVHGENILIAEKAAPFITLLDQLALYPGKYESIGENAAEMIRQNFDNFVLAEKLSTFYRMHLQL